MRTKSLDFSRLPEERRERVLHAVDLLFKAVQFDCSIGIMLGEVRDYIAQLGWSSSRNYVERYGGNLSEIRTHSYYLNRKVRQLIRLSRDEQKMGLYLIDNNAEAALTELSRLHIKRNEMKLVARMVIKRMERLGQFTPERSTGFRSLPRVGHEMDWYGYPRYRDRNDTEHESSGLVCERCEYGDIEIKPELVRTNYGSLDLSIEQHMKTFSGSSLLRKSTVA